MRALLEKIGKQIFVKSDVLVLTSYCKHNIALDNVSPSGVESDRGTVNCKTSRVELSEPTTAYKQKFGFGLAKQTYVLERGCIREFETAC